VNDSVVPLSYHSAVSPSGHPGRFHPDAAPRDAIPRLAPGAALIVTLLLSVGLWGTIWLGVSAFPDPGARKAVLELAESFDRLARAAATPTVLRRGILAMKDRERNW
jgi:hypothetical protein